MSAEFAQVSRGIQLAGLPGELSAYRGDTNSPGNSPDVLNLPRPPAS